ncbi:MAG: hypothetical protein JNJ57_21905, partial [Saprospiraceae bacterium]|nr:hypothetical protein [Saprospiraceae bacterium]
IDDKKPPKMVCSELIYTCATSNYAPEYMFNELGIQEAYPTVSDNCQSYTLTYVDQFFNLPCALPLNALAVSSAWVRRDWRAVDAAGNVATCGQAIYFVRRHLSDLTFPADTVLDCSQTNTTPTATGAPYLTEYGVNFSIYPNEGYCEFSTVFTDELVESCDGSKKILREWTVFEDCPLTGEPEYLSRTQLIKILDTKGPQFICPPADTVSIDPQTCCAKVDLPDVYVSDNCSRINRFEAIIQTFDVWTQDSTGTFGQYAALSTFPNNNLWHPDTLAVFGLTECLPPGTHHVTYKALDDCGNERKCSFELVVNDQVPPIIACDTYTKVALTDQGLAEVFASTFDNGSYDYCCPIQLVAARMDGDCDGFDDEFDPSVWFCCSDIGDTIRVVMRAYDCGDQYDECMVQVIVEDKIRPVCLVEPKIDVECAFFDPTLETYGYAESEDNCCTDEITVNVNYNQFDSICNRGTIVRTFRAFDCAGNSSQCTQRIITHYKQYFYLKMPDDKIVNSCDGTGSYGEPLIHFEDCELIGLSYEDEVFTVVPEGCYRIDRHWKIINWCTYNPNGGCIKIPNPDISQQRPFILPGPIISPIGTTGPWAPTITLVNPGDPAVTNYGIFWDQNANCYEYKQMILIFDIKDPVLEGCSPALKQVCDFTDNHGALWNESYWWDPITLSHNLCEGPVDCSLTASDACTMADVRFKFLLFLDLDRNGVMETVVNSSDPPPPGKVYFGNALNPGFSGGELRTFDQRAVPDNQKYNFALTESINGNKKTASIRWKTAAELNTPGSAGVLPELPYGRHRVKWVVEDGCTNESLCEHNFEVNDCKNPTVVCRNGLSTSIMPMGMITLWASDFLQYTNDNCSPTDQIRLGIRRSGTGTGFPMDFESNPINNITFDCSEIGSQPVELWAMDLAGNADYCETVIVVQDNQGVCSNVAQVSGTIKTEDAITVPGAEVELVGSAPFVASFSFSSQTTSDGVFQFVSVPVAANYTLTPVKDDNPTNGVTTFDLVEISKHILGVKPLGSPYKMIAADANRSNSITSFDIIELRKLVLGVYQELPHNSSWRFIDRDFAFPNPANPFQSPFPENISVNNFQTARNEEDFVGVKIGDVNGTVAPGASPEQHSSRSRPVLDFQVDCNRAGLIHEGDLFELTIRSAESASGYQFTLHTEGLVVEDMIPVSNFQVEQSAWFPARHILTVAVESGGFSAFRLKCKALKTGFLQDMLRLGSDVTVAEAYIVSAETNTVTLATPVLKFPEPQGFEVYAPQPNPFKDQTAVGFFLPEAGNVTLTLNDETGRIVWSGETTFQRGFNLFQLDLQQTKTNGWLFYQVESSHGAAAGKLIRAD